MRRVRAMIGLLSLGCLLGGLFALLWAYPRSDRDLRVPEPSPRGR